MNSLWFLGWRGWWWPCKPAESTEPFASSTVIGQRKRSGRLAAATRYLAIATHRLSRVRIIAAAAAIELMIVVHTWSNIYIYIYIVVDELIWATGMCTHTLLPWYFNPTLLYLATYSTDQRLFFSRHNSPVHTHKLQRDDRWTDSTQPSALAICVASSARLPHWWGIFITGFPMHCQSQQNSKNR